MKKFRNDNDVDEFEDIEDIEVKSKKATQPEEGNRKLIKIILNTILVIAIIKVGLGVFQRYYFNEFYYKAPNLTGLSIEEAKKTISKSALNIREMGEVYSDLPYGTVALQEPVEGTIVKRARNIKVWISKESPSVFLDDLVGMNYIEASSLLNKNDMKVGEVKKMRSDLPINQIIATSPKSGEPISRGQKFDFLISNGLE
ncbi:PASTA domain-containing protein [uncultured Fusobacterium sp.]|uniref:PASTA domain-containing protein n=1 Tax=uncultured Fusobacterium sp. TaxID=159267 RepID=UPI00262A9F7C|nr:PASTA domain-containing protein [uncultured Fusobacterium sp.]